MRTLPLTALANALLIVTLGVSPVMAQAPEPAPEAMPDAAVSADSPNASSPPKAQRLIITTGQGESQLAQRFPDQVVWLDLPDGSRSLGLLAQESTPARKGAVLLLQDEGRSAAAPALAELTDALADGGWAVLSLAIPRIAARAGDASEEAAAAAPADPQADPPPGADSAVAAGGQMPIPVEAASEPMIETSQEVVDGQAVDDLLRQASQALAAMGYERVIPAGVGGSARFVARFMAASGSARQEMIWIMPRWDRERQNSLMATLIESGKMNILDLYSRSDAQLARQRQAQMRRAGMGGYVAQPLGRTEGQTGSGLIGNRIMGWLKQREREQPAQDGGVDQSR